MAVAKASKAQVLEPIKVSEASDLPFVNESKNYKCVIQLGHSWRKYKGGRWHETEVSSDQRGGTVRKYEFRPKVHETGALPGRTVNGLISSHNDWLKANHEKRKEGLMKRMVLVIDIEETDEVPEYKIDADKQAIQSLAKAASKLIEWLEGNKK